MQLIDTLSQHDRAGFQKLTKEMHNYGVRVSLNNKYRIVASKSRQLELTLATKKKPPKNWLPKYMANGIKRFHDVLACTILHHAGAVLGEFELPPVCPYCSTPIEGVPSHANVSSLSLFSSVAQGASAAA